MFQKKKNEIIKKNEKFENVNLTRKNLFIFNNFDEKQFYKENKIIEAINGPISEMSESIKSMKPKIRFNNKICKVDGNCYNQSYILTNLIKIYNKYIVDLDEKHIDFTKLIDFCMNILVYMRNCTEFEDKDDIKENVEKIFFLFLNKLKI